MVLACPLLADGSECHAAQRVPRRGMDHGEIEVADEQGETCEDRQVEAQPGEEQHEEAERVHPVQRALGAREAADVARHELYPFERPTHASRSYPSTSQ